MVWILPWEVEFLRVLFRFGVAYLDSYIISLFSLGVDY